MASEFQKNMKRRSSSLRKEMTQEERRLWYCFLKELPETVRRQKVIGNYIVDFCIPEKKLVIELDGTQHFEEVGSEADKIRDRYLKKQGYTVLRYANNEVNQKFKWVCLDICKHIGITDI